MWERDEEERMASGYDGHHAKRQRTEDGPRGREGGDPHKPNPSPVVHVRGLSDAATEADLIQAVQHFGGVGYVIMMPRRHQALVEFEDITGARNCVNYSQSNAIYVGAQAAYFNYSTSQRIQRPGGGDDPKAPNHILLFTILNPQYPITVDVMHTICGPYGQVQRIVIFKKNGVQAMVEFESVESAKRAKQSLNGADIYSGCCTLKIDFAKPERLNVIRNDQDSWDYTNPNLGKDYQSPPNRGAPLLQDPRYSSGPTPYGNEQGFDSRVMGSPGGYSAPSGGDYWGSTDSRGPPGGYNAQGSGGGYGGPGGPGGYNTGGSGYGGYDQSDGYTGGYGGGPNRGQQYDGGFGPKSDRGFGRAPLQQYPDVGSQSPGGVPQQGAVLMVYGLNMDKINCERLFNLFCLYGNVVRIKFLKSKEGSAMIQMGDALAVDRCIQNLSNCTFFGNKMQLGHSKQAFLQDVPNPHEIPDGTSSFKDFMGSRNNRFTNPEAASKNRIQSPSKVLHFYNAPPSIPDEELEELFVNAGAAKPVKVKQFPSRTDRSSTGLVEFENKSESVEALILANHMSVNNPGGKNPFCFKLCFSASPIINN